MLRIAGMKADLVAQFPTNEPDRLADAEADIVAHNADLKSGRNPYREAAPRPPSAEPIVPPERAGTKEWPASVSRDEPEKLSVQTKSHTFFVRTQRRELLTNIDVLGFIAKCPAASDGQGVLVHRDVIHSLGYHLLDKVHELDELRKGLTGKDSRYDEKLSKAFDQLGDKDAEIKELRAALGEAAVKIRRLETKLFK